MPDEGAAVPAGLNRILADCFVLRGAVQVASWRLQPDDRGTERRLDRLMRFLDDTGGKIAIRVRVLGGTPAGGLEELIRLASCRPAPPGGDTPHFGELAQASIEVARDFHTMGQIAQESGDVATACLLRGRVGQIEEAAWRLASRAKAAEMDPGPGAL